MALIAPAMALQLSWFKLHVLRIRLLISDFLEFGQLPHPERQVPGPGPAALAVTETESTEWHPKSAGFAMVQPFGC